MPSDHNYEPAITVCKYGSPEQSDYKIPNLILSTLNFGRRRKAKKS